MRLRAALAVLLLSSAAAVAGDPPPVDLGHVEVTGTRAPSPVFDTPTSMSVITSDDIAVGPPGASLAQTLARVPGLVAQNRQSYAQDLQLSSRGFGARASFGVRGIRLLVDGLPATTPAGQGETDIFDLAIAKRIEVLRGPFSTLYGNASGGVIQIFTKDGPPKPTVTGRAFVGRYGQRFTHLEGGGTDGDLNYIVDVSHFGTDGYRRHGAAQRDHAHAKLRYDLGGDSSVTLLFDGENQPFAEDPSSLTKKQLSQNPRQAVANVFKFNSGETHRARQGGIEWRQRIDAHDKLYVMGWLGARRVLQFLPFPGAGITSGGAVIDLQNRSGGGEARFTHDGGFYTVTAGADYQRLRQARKGHVNDDGRIGALRRDEDDVSSQAGEYVQGRVKLDPWRLFAGVRHSRVAFDSDDHFLADGRNDSGQRYFARTDPVAGVLYQVNPSLNVYANYGIGFQTPTFDELVYKPNSRTGFNPLLGPSISRNYEVGVKARPASGRVRLTASFFNIDTDNEIVVAESLNGRTSYKNAGSTRRSGVELTLDAGLGDGFKTHVAYSELDAVFTGARLHDNRLPGIPRRTLFAELSWRYAPLGFNAAIHAQWRGRVYVDSANSQASAGYAVVGLRAGLHQQTGSFRLHEYARVDNLFDRAYAGAVVVNSGNGRYYEPAPGRNVLVGLSVSYVF
jgi:iron complex outermembrane receptor protein